MRKSLLHSVICWALIAVFPASLLAVDSNAAMLYSKGQTWLNGAAVPRSSAIFSGDLVQTKPDSVASINASGSKVIILADSLIKFEGDAVSVEHGTVTVATSKGMATHIGDVTVTPSANAWTEFDVADLDGTVQIMARKGDLSINDGEATTTLAQGQQTTVDESQDHKKKRRKRAGAEVAATGSILNSTAAIIAGSAVVGGVLTWVLIQGDDPMSPTHP